MIIDYWFRFRSFLSSKSNSSSKLNSFLNKGPTLGLSISYNFNRLSPYNSFYNPLDYF